MDPEDEPTNFSGRVFQVRAPEGVTWEDLMDEGHTKPWPEVPKPPMTWEELTSMLEQAGHIKGVFRKRGVYSAMERLMHPTHGYTRHGHPCCFDAPKPPKPFAKVPCGLRGCADCEDDLSRLHSPILEATVRAEPAEPVDPDLDAIESKWLAECGGCLGAFGYGHTCEDLGDPRPVIASLVRELRRLRVLQAKAVQVTMTPFNNFVTGPGAGQEKTHGG